MSIDRLPPQQAAVKLDQLRKSGPTASNDLKKMQNGETKSFSLQGELVTVTKNGDDFEVMVSKFIDVTQSLQQNGQKSAENRLNESLKDMPRQYKDGAVSIDLNRTIGKIVVDGKNPVEQRAINTFLEEFKQNLCNDLGFSKDLNYLKAVADGKLSPSDMLTGCEITRHDMNSILTDKAYTQIEFSPEVYTKARVIAKGLYEQQMSEIKNFDNTAADVISKNTGKFISPFVEMKTQAKAIQNKLSEYSGQPMEYLDVGYINNRNGMSDFSTAFLIQTKDGGYVVVDPNSKGAPTFPPEPLTAKTKQEAIMSFFDTKARNLENGKFVYSLNGNNFKSVNTTDCTTVLTKGKKVADKIMEGVGTVSLALTAATFMIPANPYTTEFTGAAAAETGTVSMVYFAADGTLTILDKALHGSLQLDDPEVHLALSQIVFGIALRKKIPPAVAKALLAGGNVLLIEGLIRDVKSKGGNKEEMTKAILQGCLSLAMTMLSGKLQTKIGTAREMYLKMDYRTQQKLVFTKMGININSRGQLVMLNKEGPIKVNVPRSDNNVALQYKSVSQTSKNSKSEIVYASVRGKNLEVNRIITPRDGKVVTIEMNNLPKGVKADVLGKVCRDYSGKELSTKLESMGFSKEMASKMANADVIGGSDWCISTKNFNDYVGSQMGPNDVPVWGHTHTISEQLSGEDLIAGKPVTLQQDMRYTDAAGKPQVLPKGVSVYMNEVIVDGVPTTYAFNKSTGLIIKLGITGNTTVQREKGVSFKESWDGFVTNQVSTKLHAIGYDEGDVGRGTIKLRFTSLKDLTEATTKIIPKSFSGGDMKMGEKIDILGSARPTEQVNTDGSKQWSIEIKYTPPREPEPMPEFTKEPEEIKKEINDSQKEMKKRQITDPNIPDFDVVDGKIYVTGYKGSDKEFAGALKRLKEVEHLPGRLLGPDTQKSWDHILTTDWTKWVHGEGVAGSQPWELATK